MLYLFPDSESRPLNEVNHCHGKGRGHPCDGPKAGDDASDKGKQPVDANGRPIPIKASSIKQAIDLVLQGKVVELPHVKTAATVLTRLAAMAKEAESLGEDAPTYDLCKVTVANTNLFCASKVTDKDNPQGIERIKMPQLGDHQDKFIAFLEESGIKVTKTGTGDHEMPLAKDLKASQSELVGSKVAGMMTNPKFNPSDPNKPIFVSSDNYVVDGHHRWAATVGKDASDGKLGSLRMPTLRIEAPITEILQIAKVFTEKFKIAGASGSTDKQISKAAQDNLFRRTAKKKKVA